MKIPQNDSSNVASNNESINNIPPVSKIRIFVKNETKGDNLMNEKK